MGVFCQLAGMGINKKNSINEYCFGKFQMVFHYKSLSIYSTTEDFS